MAARLEIFAIDEGTRLESWDAAVLDAEGADRTQLPDLEGYVSASDDDEEALFALLSQVAERTAFDARSQGAGALGAEVVAQLAPKLRSLAAESSDLSGSWLSSLAAAVGKVGHRGAAMGWRMRYDQGGSTDAGAEEFPTAWS